MSEYSNRPAPPQRHADEGYAQQQMPQFVGMTNNDVASKVVDAYKVNPMLTGLLLLNLIIFVGAGYYLNTVQERTYNYIRDRDNHEFERTQKTFDMLKNCVVSEAPRYAPQPQYYQPPIPSPYQPTPAPYAPAPTTPAPEQPVAVTPPHPRPAPPPRPTK